MIEYSEFVRLSQSSDSDERGHAAHLAALAYLDHQGPADEHAALYAALISFLDDPSVKVRAALAYALLHSAEAPRPIIMALLRDRAIIANAILEYSPILLDADLMVVVREADLTALLAIAQRANLSSRVAAAIIGQGDRQLILKLLRRREITLPADLLCTLAGQLGEDKTARGVLVARSDLPASARMVLVRHAAEALRHARIVKGALAPERLNRTLRDGADTALTSIGEIESVNARAAFVEGLVGSNQLSTRVLLHAVISGHVMFFAACIGELAGVSRDKVFAMLEDGGSASLNALFLRCDLRPAVARLLVRMVLHARAADLSDDVAARHYVVTALTEELIADHDGAIPVELEEAFAYLSEQNIALARRAARGVMAAFAGTTAMPMSLPDADDEDELLELPAA